MTWWRIRLVVWDGDNAADVAEALGITAGMVIGQAGTAGLTTRVVGDGDDPAAVLEFLGLRPGDGVAVDIATGRPVAPIRARNVARWRRMIGGALS